MISIYYSPKWDNLMLLNIAKDGNIYVLDKTMGSLENIKTIIIDLIRSEYEFIGNFKE